MACPGFFISCANHLSWRPLEGPHCFIHTEKGKKVTLDGWCSKSLSKGRVMRRKRGLSPMPYFLIVLPSGFCQREQQGERGLLVNSGWDSALALQPSGSVTLCKLLTLAEPRGDHSLLSRPSTDMLPQLKNGKARYLAQSCAYVRHSGWCLIVMWDGFQAATQVWGTS